MKKATLFALVLTVATVPGFAGSNPNDSTQLEIDNNAIGHYTGLTNANLEDASRRASAEASQSEENAISQAVLDIFRITSVSNRVAVWANSMISTFQPPPGNADPTPIADIKSCTDSKGMVHNDTTDLVGLIVCFLQNNQSLIATANADLAAIPPITSDMTFTGYLQTANNDFSHVNTYYTNAVNDGMGLMNPLNAPSQTIQNALYYSFVAHHWLGAENQGQAINEAVELIQAGGFPTTLSLDYALSIMQNIDNANSLVRDADAYVMGLHQDGTIIRITMTPLQDAVGALLEPTNNVPYRLSTGLLAIGDINFLTGLANANLIALAAHIGDAWRGTDGEAYTILDSLVVPPPCVS